MGPKLLAAVTDVNCVVLLLLVDTEEAEDTPTIDWAIDEAAAIIPFSKACTAAALLLLLAVTTVVVLVFTEDIELAFMAAVVVIALRPEA